MAILGGMASYDSVSFFGDKYTVTTRYNKKKDKIDTIIQENPNDTKLISFIRKIPFARGILLPIATTLSTWKTLWKLYVIVMLLSLLLIYIATKISTSPDPVSINKTSLILQFVFFILAIKIFIGKYHGAEHKAFNCYLQNEELTIDNIMKHSRTTENCGTNLVIIMIFLQVVLYPFLGATGFTYLIVWSLGYELFLLLSKGNVLLKPFAFLARLVQWFFVTSEPTEKECKIATISLNKLIEIEE